MSEQTSKAQAVPVWDLALRVFHWLLAAAVIATIVLAKFGPAIMTLHFYLGYLVIGLLVFRLIWGLVGPKPARFASFMFGPRATFAYLRDLPARRPSFWPGHSPAGALSVFALLAVLAAQAATGLFSDPDDYINAGPLARWVEFEWARWANGWHHRLSNLVIALIGLHLAAILFYRIWKREDLVTPMITGVKAVRDPGENTPDA
ncbi:cytochrome b/b6 domain-containing protein [Aliiroseovarius crassostreae]|uniref:cytochrome b/b6 domain-containing protein n=1 Tax=Aliiroseovarius crassostreae TaxID=154981 RepID=UPI003C7E8922